MSRCGLDQRQHGALERAALREDLVRLVRRAPRRTRPPATRRAATPRAGWRTDRRGPFPCATATRRRPSRAARRAWSRQAPRFGTGRRQSRRGRARGTRGVAERARMSFSMPSSVTVRPATRCVSRSKAPEIWRTLPAGYADERAADRVVVDHGAQHERVVGVDPERALLLRRALRLRRAAGPSSDATNRSSARARSSARCNRQSRRGRRGRAADRTAGRVRSSVDGARPARAAERKSCTNQQCRRTRETHPVTIPERENRPAAALKASGASRLAGARRPG